jgi:transposase
MARTIMPMTNEKDSLLMEELLKAGHIEYKYVVRLQAVLKRAKGSSTNDIAFFLGINLNSVSNYVKRHNAGGAEALLKGKARKPGTAPISEDAKNQTVRLACQEKPKDMAHWSIRELSKRFGISHTAREEY